MAVNSKGVLDVAKLVIAIEKCVAAQAAHKVLDTAHKERAALERHAMIAIDEKKWCPTCKRWVLYLQAPDACYCYRCDSRVRCLKPGDDE